MNNDVKQYVRSTLQHGQGLTNLLGFAVVTGLPNTVAQYLSAPSLPRPANITRRANPILQQMAAYHTLKKTEAVAS